MKDAGSKIQGPGCRIASVNRIGMHLAVLRLEVCFAPQHESDSARQKNRHVCVNFGESRLFFAPKLTDV